MAIKISGTTVIDDSRNVTNAGTIEGLSYPTSDGSTGQVLATDGSSSLSFQDIPPSVPTIQAVANGTLPDGSPVVVNSDGTVEVVFEDYGDNIVSNDQIYSSAATEIPTRIVYDTAEEKIAIVYRDASNNNYGTVVVGDISGTSISFGTPTVYYSGAVGSGYSTTYDSGAGKIVIAYKDREPGVFDSGYGYGYAIVGDISGTSINFGSSTVFESEVIYDPAIVYEPGSGKNVIVYAAEQENTTSDNLKAIVGDVSGTSINFGTAEVSSQPTDDWKNFKITNVDSGKVCFIYENSAQYAVVGTISGSSISLGTPYEYTNTGFTGGADIAYDPIAEKVLIADKSQLYLGTISGSSISFNNIGTIGFSDIYFEITYDPSSGKMIIAYGDTPGDIYVRAGIISGSSIDLEQSFRIRNQYTDKFSLARDASSSNRYIIAYADEDNSDYGTYNIFSTPVLESNLTNESFIGFSDAQYFNTDTATIQTGGSIDDAQSGLTAGQSYFVQRDGTLDTTPDSPSVRAGLSLSSTDLLIKG